MIVLRDFTIEILGYRRSCGVTSKKNERDRLKLKLLFLIQKYFNPARALTTLLFQGPLQTSFPIFSMIFPIFLRIFKCSHFKIFWLHQDVDMNMGCITGTKNSGRGYVG